MSNKTTADKKIITYTKALAISKKYTNLAEFRVSDAEVYKVALHVLKNNEWNVFEHIKPKPNGYWTIDNLELEAKKYKTLSEFQRNNSSAYSIACKLNIMKDISKHFTRKIKSHGYWKDKDNVLNISKKYTSYKEFIKNEQVAYHAASKYGFLDKITQHMKKDRPQGYWNDKENVLNFAKQFKTRTEFYQSGTGAPHAAAKHGWIDEATEHMTRVQREKGYWTFERLQLEAQKYNRRSDFKKKSSTAYNNARRLEYLDVICSHMSKEKIQHKRCTYVIYNDRLNLAYVGITKNFDERMESHKSSNKTTNSKFITHQHDTIFKKVSNYIYDTPKKIKEAEQRLYNKYKQLGYKLLNSTSSIGTLGTSREFITKSKCIKAADKCLTKSEFKNKYPSEYNKACKAGWITEISEHLTSSIINHEVNLLKEVAKQFSTKKEFRENKRKEYLSAYQKGILNDICLHMDKFRADPEERTYEALKIICNQYTEFKKFSIEQKQALSVIHKYKWHKLTEHMDKYVVKPRRWTDEKLREEAKKFTRKVDFHKNSSGAYTIAHRKGILDEICQHMIPTVKKPGYWTKERCASEAKKYLTRTEFSIGSGGAYTKAKREKWLNEICGHMKRKNKNS